MTTFIYALVDPITDEIRYIGKSDNPERRLVTHCIPSGLKSNSHRNNWIKLLHSNGLQPKLKIIEEVSLEFWEETEIYYIAYYKYFYDLTNVLSGGLVGNDKPNLGNKGRYKASEETKLKISLSHLKRKPNPKLSFKCMTHDQETKNKMSQGHLRRRLLGLKRAAKKPVTEETKNKMSEAKKNQPILSCLYCLKEGPKFAMTRYHFDNCKNKP